MQTKSEPKATESAEAEGPADTVIVDLGKRPGRLIKELCNGEGKLVDEVDHVVAELKKAGTIPSSSSTVVVVVRPRRERTLGWPF